MREKERYEAITAAKVPYLRVHVFARPDGQGANLVWSEAEQLWISKGWIFSDASANLAIGAEIHLHEAQAAPSWKAGQIVRWERSNEDKRRVFFHFKSDDGMTGRVQGDGWGVEQARVKT